MNQENILSVSQHTTGYVGCVPALMRERLQAEAAGAVGGLGGAAPPAGGGRGAARNAAAPSRALTPAEEMRFVDLHSHKGVTEFVGRKLGEKKRGYHRFAYNVRFRNVSNDRIFRIIGRDLQFFAQHKGEGFIVFFGLF